MGEEMAEEKSAQDSLFDVIDQYRDRFPRQRKPCILICGATGAGKSTTINTLFGSEVSMVGHYARGTAQDQLYVWESRSANIDIVDLPGLGDSKERDREYRDIYRQRIAEADGFIVVTTPPRPASLPTLRTVKLLLTCGVPAANITIALNRLSLMNVTIDGDLAPVQIAGLGGPVEPEERAAIDEARRHLLDDLRAGTGTPQFSIDQVVPYDALSGWNLFGVLNSVLGSLPGDTLIRWRGAVESSARRAVERQAKRSRRDERRISQLEGQIAQLRHDLSRKLDSSAVPAEASSPQIRALQQEVRKEQKRQEAIAEGVSATLREADQHEKGITDRFADFLDRNGLERAAQAVRSVRTYAKKLLDGFRDRG
jgi:tRNA U34 5-carboxymethylaminomethyl modifying GTPase MnmE/TrmE